MEPVLETMGLSKRYGRKMVVNEVNMRIEKGDIYGFIGRNGAGKTTLMRLVLGQAFPTEGEIRLFGSDDLAQGRRRLGALVEHPALFMNCSALENLQRFSLLNETHETEEELRELLNFVGLNTVGRTKVSKFSLGMRQRLAIAIALLGNPDFLVLDEPVNGLDPAGIRDVRDLILRLNREKGMTFLISSHLLDELAKVVTRYGIIDEGCLVEEISAQEIQNLCRRQLVISVDQPEEAAQVLAAMVPAAEIQVSENTVILDSHFEERAEINRLLMDNGILVSDISFTAADMEQYFVERMGG